MHTLCWGGVKDAAGSTSAGVASQAHRCSPLLPEYHVQEAFGLLSHGCLRCRSSTNNFRVFFSLPRFFIQISWGRWPHRFLATLCLRALVSPKSLLLSNAFWRSYSRVHSILQARCKSVGRKILGPILCTRMKVFRPYARARNHFHQRKCRTPTCPLSFVSLHCLSCFACIIVRAVSLALRRINSIIHIDICMNLCVYLYAYCLSMYLSINLSFYMHVVLCVCVCVRERECVGGW